MGGGAENTIREGEVQMRRVGEERRRWEEEQRIGSEKERRRGKENSGGGGEKERRGKKERSVGEEQRRRGTGMERRRKIKCCGMERGRVVVSNIGKSFFKSKYEANLFLLIIRYLWRYSNI